MIGIDYGTSTTEVALCDGGPPRLLADSEGREVMPSVVAYLPRGQRLVGTAAEARRLIDPVNTLHSVKRIIGLKWFDKTVAEFRDSHAFDMEPGDDGLPRFLTREGKLTPTEVASHLLETLRADVRVAHSEQVIVTAPPSFEREQRMAVTVAAIKAGFEKVNVIDEPYAAVLPYLDRGGDTRTVAVYDLGGGTFDVAVMRVSGLTHQILASGGDPYLGGDDLDRALAETVQQKVLEQFQWDIRTSREAWHGLLGASRLAKERLAKLPETRIPLSLVEPVLAGKQVTVTQDELHHAIHELVQRTFAICDDVLRQAGVVAQQIDQVILAGGSTYLPAIQQGVRLYFGKEPTASVPPDRVVALGAAISAAVRGGEGSRRPA